MFPFVLVGQLTLQDSLVAHYPFNGNANDATGNGYNATNFGASLTTDRFGNPNSAYEFNGTSDYINTFSTFDFDFRTLAVWVNPYNVQGNGLNEKHVAGQDAASLSYGQLKIKFSNGNIEGRAGGENSNFLFPAAPNQWYHIVWVRDGATCRYYVNNTLVGTAPSGTVGSTNQPNPIFFIGKGRYPNDQYFEGVIDDVRIYNRALSSSEIDSLYTESNPVQVSSCDSTKSTFFAAYGTNKNIEFHSVLVDKDQNLVMAGTVSQSSGNRDFLIMKTNPAGNVIFSETYGSSNDDEGRAINLVEDEGTGYVLTGLTGTESVLLKVDYSGNLLFSQSFSDSGNNLKFNDSEIFPNGDIIVSGNESGDFFVARLNPLGGIVWWERIGSPIDFDQSTGLEVLPDSSILCFINQRSNVVGGTRDGAVVRLDQNGNQMWLKNYGSVAQDGIRDGCYSAIDSSIYAVGYIGNPGSRDVSLYKIDLSGNLIWSKLLTHTNSAHPATIVPDNKGSFFIYLNTNPPAFSKQVGIIQVDTSGNVLLSRSIGGIFNDESPFASSSLTYHNNSVFMVGFGNSIAVGGNTINTKGFIYKSNLCFDFSCADLTLPITPQNAPVQESTLNFGKVSSGTPSNISFSQSALSLEDSISCGYSPQTSQPTSCDSSASNFFLEVRHSSDIKLQGLVEDKDGNIAAIGTILNSVFGALDVCFFKFSPSGKLLDSKVYGTVVDEEGRSVSIDEIEGIGYYIGFNTGSASSRSSTIMQIDYQGNILWVKDVCDQNSCILRSLHTTQDRGVLFTGNSNDDGKIGKLSTTGALEWYQKVQGQGVEQFSGIIELPDSSIIGIAHITPQGGGAQDGALVKLSKGGAEIWSFAYGGILNDPFVDACYNITQNVIYVVGNIDNSTKDILLLKVDTSGNLLSSHSLDGGNFDKPSGIYCGKDNSHYISAYTDNGFDPTDLLLVKLDSNLNIEFAESYGSTGADESGKWGRCFTETDSGLFYVGYGNGNIPGEGFNSYFLKTNSCGEVNCQSSPVNMTITNENITQTNLNYTYSSGAPIQNSAVTMAPLFPNIDTVCYFMPTKICQVYTQLDSINSLKTGFLNQLSTNDNFGKALTHMDDFDNDGNEEIAVSAVLDDDGFTDAGAVYIIDIDATYNYQSFVKISASSGGLSGMGADFRFGSGIDYLGDFDGDGIGDLVVGKPRDPGNGFNRGSIEILLLNANGTVKSQTSIGDGFGGFTASLANNDFFGFSVANMGDLDGDGITDIAASAYKDDDGNTNAGCVYLLFLNANGTVKAQQKISATQGAFGTSLDVEDNFGVTLTNAGDLNNDGINDLLVAAHKDDDGATDAGAVYFLFLRSNGTVKKSIKISNNHPAFNGNFVANTSFGRGLDLLGDLDQDGYSEFAVGSHQPNTSGAVYVFEMDTSGNVNDWFEINEDTPGLANRIKAGDLFSVSLSQIRLDPSTGIRTMAVASTNGGVGQEGQVLLFSIEDTCLTTCSLSGSIAPTAQAICVNDTLSLSASTQNDTAFTWRVNGQFLTSNTDTFLVFNQDTNLTIQLRFANAQCSDSASTTIQVFELPSLNTAPDAQACVGDTLSIGVPNPAIFHYQWQTDPLLVASNQSLSSVLVPDTLPRTYVITATDSSTANCSAFDTIQVKGIALPEVSTQEDTSVCFASTFTLTPDSVITNSYYWTDFSQTFIDSGAARSQYVDSLTNLVFTAIEPVLGCSKSDSVSLFVLPKLNLIAPEDSSLCQGDTLTVSIPSIKHTRILWSPSLGVANPTSFSPSIFGVDSTLNYLLSVTDTLQGCSAEDSVTIRANPSDFLTLSLDTNLCQPESLFVTQSLTGPYRFNWSPGALFSDSSSLTTAFYADSGKFVGYLSTIDTSTGCVDEDSIQINVLAFKAGNIPTDTAFCEGDSASFEIPTSLADVYYWTPSTGIVSPFSNTQVFSLTDTLISYSITQIDTQSGCIQTDTLSVSLRSNQLSLPFDTLFGCKNTSLEVPSMPQAVSYLWKPGAFYSDSTATTPVLTFNTGEKYSVALTDSNNCFKVFPFQVTIVSLPRPEVITYQRSNCDDQLFRAELLNQADFNSFQWWLNGGFLSENSTIEEQAAHNTLFDLHLQYGVNSTCRDTLTIAFQEDVLDSLMDNLQFPNIFTPNSDGINDFLEVNLPVQFQACSELYVFNRWGQLLYSSEGRSIKYWDGTTFAGSRAEEGIYLYVMRILDREFKGTVKLNR